MLLIADEISAGNLPGGYVQQTITATVPRKEYACCRPAFVELCAIGCQGLGPKRLVLQGVILGNCGSSAARRRLRT